MPHRLPGEPWSRERLARLRAGQRWWPAEILSRIAALGLLAVFWRLALLEHRLSLTPAPRPPCAADLLACLGMVALLVSGLALGMAGPGLLREVELPGHFSARGDFSIPPRS